MRIKDILQEKGAGVVTIAADRSIHDAISVLNEFRIGSLIVKGDHEEVVGIITERDILRACGEHCGRMDKSTTPEETACSNLVQDSMTRELITGVPDDGPNFIMGIMTKNRIRHLPIVDEGNLVGIISLGDLVNVHLEEKVIENRTLKDYLSRNATPTRI